MAGKIFYRERRKVAENERKPRYIIVGVADLNLKLRAKHLRKHELEQVAEAVGAELVALEVADKGHKMQAPAD